MNTMHNGWIRSVSWARLVGVTRPAVNLFYCTGLALGLTLALAPRAEAAGPYYVALSGSGGNGLSWGTAFTNVQTAIDAAADGETIYLKGETFTLPTNSANGKLVWSGKGLTILGGYAGDGGSPGALTSTATVFYNANAAAANTNRVLYISGVTNGTLRRLTIRGGAVGWPTPQVDFLPYYGAGIYMTASSNMVLDTVTLDGNFVGGQQGVNAFGGGMYAAADTYGVLTNCTVRNSSIQTMYNTINYGSGIYLAGGAWSIVDSVVRDNLIFRYGNTATVRGIGVYMAGGNHLIRNCAFSRNTCTGNTPQGDAVYVAGGTVNIVNCTVYWQQTEGIRQAGGTVTVKDSIVWANGDDIAGTITLQNNDIEDGDSVNVNGNISADPQFERGLYLATSSPCVNTGSQTAASAGLDAYTTRADGTADSGTVDLGYHYAGGVAVPNLYVSVNSGNDANAGTAPGAGNAFKTIGKALATAGDGTRINIEAGNYTTNTETFPLTAANKLGLQLLGTNSATTVLSAKGASARVLTMSYCYPDARIEGLTLANASWAKDAADGVGGGVWLSHVMGAIASCAITNNALNNPNGWAAPSGGGIYAVDGNVLISNCVIRGNSVAPWYASKGYGGGVFASGQGALVNCEISRNIAGPQGSYQDLVQGGGLYLNGNFALRNCLIFTNDVIPYTTPAANAVGDGVCVAGGVVVFENCTIATNKGEGVRQVGGTVAVTNSILWGNGVDATGTVIAAYSDIGVAGPAVTLFSCLSTNPLFMFPATNNYRLAEGSPCINAGLNLSWMTGATDLDGQRRIMAGRVDIGAYEAMPPGGTTFKFR